MKARKSISIRFTKEQENLIDDFFISHHDFVDGGAVIAQVYPDGLKATVLTPDEALRVFEILNLGASSKDIDGCRTLAEREGKTA